MIPSEGVPDLIRRLNEVDEDASLEAKAISQGTLGKSFWETVSAFCNEPGLGGGTILLGVEREQTLFPLYKPAGVSDPDKIASDISSGCNSTFNRPVRVKIATEVVGDARIVRVDVAEAEANEKPIFIASRNLPQGAFRRIGPTDVKCTMDDLNLFFQERKNEPADKTSVKGASWDDIDLTAIEAYRNARKEANPLAEELNWSDEEVLRALGAIDIENGIAKVTLAGLVAFGKSSALRRLMPALRVDYIRVTGKDWVSTDENRLNSIDMRGSIFAILRRIISAILDDLPKTLRIDDGLSGQRTEIPVLPVRVIREAVVNALMHRSYEVHQPVQIIRFANRIEIHNPGFSLKSQDRFDEPGSQLRNPTLAAILHETLFAETKGSGIRVMRDFMTQHGLAVPTFESDRQAQHFTAKFLFHHFLDESDWAWLSQFKEYELSEDQMKALIFVREIGAIDNATYRSQTRSDTLTASRSLRKLVSQNLLADKGSGANTHYIPGGKMIELSQGKLSLSMDAKTLSMDAYESNAPKATDLSALPESLRKRLRTSLLKQRLTPHETRHLIVSLCEWRPLSLNEIATYLTKGPAYIGQKFVSPMVADGELEYTIPQMPRHPEQKYTATKNG